MTTPKLIYVCSAYRGNPPYSPEQSAANLRAAEGYCKLVIAEGHIPIAPHLFYANLLDDTDPAQREMGLTACKKLIPQCAEVWVFGDERTEGMWRDLAVAGACGIECEVKLGKEVTT